jgi:hypothetical protein
MAAASVVAVASTAALGEPVVARLILASIFVVFLIWEGTTFGLLRRGPAPVPEQRGR